MRCPQCGATLPVNPSWPTWCEACGWNVAPPQHPPAVGRQLRRQQKVQARATALWQEVRRETPVRPYRGLRRPLATCIALLVFVPLLFFVAAAVADVVYDSGTPRLLIAAGCLGLALLLRPKFRTLDRRALSVSKESAPELFDAIAHVATAISATPPTLVVLDEAFSADCQRIGPGRRRVLFLGVPLWTILEDYEKVALLAHELAEDVNGDPSQTLLVDVALRTLSTSREAVRPGAWQSFRQSPSDYAPVPGQLQGIRRNEANNITAEFILRVIRRGVGGLIWLLRRLELRLLDPVIQRSAYVADDIAVRAASGPAVRGFLQKSLLHDYVDFALSQAARAPKEHLWAVSRQLAAEVPERELERLRRAAMLRGDRVDANHPPTALRMQFVDGRPSSAPAVSVSPGQFQAIDAELRVSYDSVATRRHGGEPQSAGAGESQ